MSDALIIGNHSATASQRAVRSSSGSRGDGRVRRRNRGGGGGSSGATGGLVSKDHLYRPIDMSSPQVCFVGPYPYGMVAFFFFFGEGGGGG